MRTNDFGKNPLPARAMEEDTSPFARAPKKCHLTPSPPPHNLVGRGPTSASAGGRVSHVSLICSTARIRAAPIRLQYFKYLQEMFTTLHVYNSTHP